MQSYVRSLLVSCVTIFFATESEADMVSFFDFEEPNNRFGWTVSSHDVVQFRFQNVDGLLWESGGGTDFSGGLRFKEQANWNWTETFVAPQTFVEAINGSHQKRISYDLATDADGGTTAPVPGTKLYLFGNGMFLYTNAGPMPLSDAGLRSYEVDLLDINREWRNRFGDPNIIIDYNTVLSVVNSLVDLHIQADHPDTNSSVATQSAWLDNVGLNVTSVPEPSCFLMLLASAGGSLFYRRLRTKV